MRKGSTAICERERSDQERRGCEPRRRAKGTGASERVVSTEDGRVGTRDETRHARAGRGSGRWRARRRAFARKDHECRDFIGDRERSDKARRGCEPRRRAEGIGASERAMSIEDGRVGSRDETQHARDGRGPGSWRARRCALRAYNKTSTAIGGRDRNGHERCDCETQRRGEGSGASERVVSTQDVQVGTLDETRRARDGRWPEQGRTWRRALREKTTNAATSLANAR